MDPTAKSTTVFDRFFPEVPANGFVSIKFEGKCAIAGNTGIVKGTACGEAVHTNEKEEFLPNATGENRAVQTLRFGEPQQKTGNSEKKPCALTFGTAAAQLTAAVDNELVGTNAGQPFAAD
jgi:hypothetical protein